MISLTRSTRWLGIFLGDSALHVAECRCDARARRVVRSAHFDLPAGVELENLTDVAGAFTAFLEKNSFETRRAIFGLPSRHFLLHLHELPRVDARTTALALWHHATTRLAPELGRVALDFIADDADSPQQRIALIGLQDRLLQKLRAFCDGAGLDPICVTPTALALAASSGAIGSNLLLVHLQPTMAEILVQIGGLPRLMRSIAPLDRAALQSELRRAAASLSGTLSAEQLGLERTVPSRSLVVWDDTLSATAPNATLNAAITEATGLPITRARTEWIDTQLAASTASDPGMVLRALIDYTTRPERPPINLLTPRITEPKTRLLSRRVSMVAACGLLCVLIATIAATDIHSIQSEASRTQAQLDSMAPALRLAKPFVKRMEYARNFSNPQPRYLACLRDVTVAVAASDSVTLGHFDLNGAMQGSCAGEAAVQQDALDFADRLNATKRFGRINCKLDAHGASGETDKVSFHIAFLYLPDN